MAAVAFDTLKLARKLRDSAEMTQVQAEGVADALAEAMSGAELATKSDINEVKSELKHDIRELELKIDALSDRTDARFEMVLERIDRRAAETDTRIYRYALAAIGAVVVSFFGAATAIIRYLPAFLQHN